MRMVFMDKALGELFATDTFANLTVNRKFFDDGSWTAQVANVPGIVELLESAKYVKFDRGDVESTFHFNNVSETGLVEKWSYDAISASYQVSGRMAEAMLTGVTSMGLNRQIPTRFFATAPSAPDVIIAMWEQYRVGEQRPWSLFGTSFSRVDASYNVETSVDFEIVNFSPKIYRLLETRNLGFRLATVDDWTKAGATIGRGPEFALGIIQPRDLSSDVLLALENGTILGYTEDIDVSDEYDAVLSQWSSEDGRYTFRALNTRDLEIKGNTQETNDKIIKAMTDNRYRTLNSINSNYTPDASATDKEVYQAIRTNALETLGEHSTAVAVNMNVSGGSVYPDVCNLGDFVSFRNPRTGKTEKRQIVEAEEVYKEGGMAARLTLGSRQITNTQRAINRAG